MKEKLFRLSLLVVVFAMLVSACAAPAPTQAPAAKPFKIAAVFPSAITDMAFAQSMWESLKKLQAESGKDRLDLAYSDNKSSVPDAAAAIRDYAQQGFDVVIAHGSQYGTSVAQVAKDFPKTSFAWGNSANTYEADGVKNVFAYQADAQQGGYVMGVIAAKMTKSKVVGVCGPVESGDAKLYVDGFKYGVAQTNKDIKVNVTYTGSFTDVSLMSAAAETHLQAGADMLTGSSQSVVGAIGVAKNKKAFWFGTQWEQTSLAPESVVANQVYDWTPVLKEIMNSVKGGTFGAKAFTLTFKNGGLKIVYNDKVQVPAEAKTAADAAIKGIQDGTVKPLP